MSIIIFISCLCASSISYLREFGGPNLLETLKKFDT
jgi:hypothetical protein